jgi:beta-lactamase class A
MKNPGTLVTLTAAVIACACAPAGEESQGQVDLDQRIRARLDSLDARASFFAKHLPTGREIAVRADQPMNSLSVIKIPMMILAYRDAEAGLLRNKSHRPGFVRQKESIT